MIQYFLSLIHARNQCATPVIVYHNAFHCLFTKRSHHRLRHAVDNSGIKIDNTLLQNKTLFRNRNNPCQHAKAFSHKGLCVKRYVYINNHYPGIAPLDLITSQIIEETRLGKIQQLELSIIVHMTEHVYITEPQLHIGQMRHRGQRCRHLEIRA